MKPKTKLEILQETADFYAADPKRRALQHPEHYYCEYLTQDGRMCAVGRCLLEPAKYRFFSGTSDTLSDEECGGGTLDPVLKPEYQGHPRHFWRELQEFHDRKVNWTDTGLSETGTAHLERLKKDFA